MLYVDGERFNKDDHKVLYSEYTRFLHEVEKQHKTHFVFKRNSLYVEDDNGRAEGVGGIFMPYKSMYKPQGEAFEREVRYSNSPPKKKDGVLVYPDIGGEIIHKNKVIGKREDPALLFYMKHISPVAIKLMKFVDEEAEAKKIVNEEKNIANVNFYLFADTSPLSEDIDMLKSLANAFGVKGADYKEENQLKVELKKAVLEAENNPDLDLGIDKLVKWVNQTDEEIKNRSYIRMAIERNIVEYNPIQNIWAYTAGGERIFELRPGEASHREFALYNFVKDSPKHIDNIKYLLGAKKDPERNVNEEFADLINQVKTVEKWHELKALDVFGIHETYQKLDSDVSKTEAYRRTLLEHLEK